MTTLEARARGKVNVAIQQGLLTPVKELRCVDCGAPAAEYDHRDYRQPLAVQAVCRKCNHLRGPGKGASTKPKPHKKRISDTSKAVQWVMDHRTPMSRVEYAARKFGVSFDNLLIALGKQKANK